MLFHQIFSGTVFIRLAILLGRVLPHETGLMISDFIGGWLGSRKGSSMVKAIRANQWVVHDQRMTAAELDVLPKIIFRSAARCLFDYFYYLPRPKALEKIVTFSPESLAAIERINSNKATVVVCPHLSNFDLMGYALTLKKIQIQVLSFPNPNISYKLQNQLRESLGITVTPMNLQSFRQARKRLASGGSILTGFDRPLPKGQIEKYQPTFFGFKTNLPVAYVRMAKEANAPVFIMAATSQTKGRYHLEGSKPIWMESAAQLENEVVANANRILRKAEGLIQKYARQWAMFYPIWPQFLGV